MIINCPKCNKKFELDSDLIPESGRLVQCGACQYQWFFKPEKKIIDPIILKDTPDKSSINTMDETKINNEDDQKFIDEKLDNKEKTSNITRLFNLIIVFIISIIAFIILIDTFKIPISNIFPEVETILYNLYESITVLKLFLINLT